MTQLDLFFYKCKAIDYPWAVRAREIVFGGTTKITAYHSYHTYNRVINNVEARVKWIV